ncbi:multicopper oxidase family protein [Okeania sp. SIO2B3]|uniref:multicopper oxidase family protein n=1 Tax=Okeania sp. SIO2B3 TaxID=2607784 RepID=UPI0013C0A054|nr:multicopper oxidase domain-containing protein [Okeania sp. SIO2B3]NET44482.1 multicopper oxidase domain-containing protein [Okeania sp. SIO2B3]
MFLVSTFTFVSTFTGEAIADKGDFPIRIDININGVPELDINVNGVPLNRVPGTATQFKSEQQIDATGNVDEFVNACTLERTDGDGIAQPDFQNPPFANADQGPVTLNATLGEFTLEGDGTGETSYQGYLYGATYAGLRRVETTLDPTYTPPTIEVSPGTRLDLTLENNLPVNVQLAGSLPPTKENLENQSQYTNIHYHGFNVSPLLGSDDVLVEVHSNVTPNPAPPPQFIDNGGYYPDDDPPGSTYGSIADYQMGVSIPDIHQSGLFWYHSHAHSMSDNQVRGGLSGGIVIKETEEFFPLLNRFKKGIKGGIKYLNPSRRQFQDEEFDVLSVPQKVMMFKDFNDVLGTKQADCFPLNGQVNPKITIKPGEIQFWRIANIGADRYMNIALETIASDTNIPSFTEPNGNTNFYILARDGDVVKEPVATNSVLLPPAARVELLVVGGETDSEYHLVSDLDTHLTTKQQQWVNDANKKSYKLATVGVTTDAPVCYTDDEGNPLSLQDESGTYICGEEGDQTLDDYIKTQTPYKVDRILPDPDILADFEECEPEEFLTARAGGPAPEKACITPSDAYSDPLTQERTFNFQAPGGGKFAINDKVYSGNRIDKISHIGDTEEWEVVNTTGAPHVFHIHQLDFLVTKVSLTKSQYPDGPPEGTYNNYTIKNGECTDDGENYICPLETQGYRDVINLPPMSTTTIRIPFVNPFIAGIFVYHCHILQHEDMGMMQNLQVVDPNAYYEPLVPEPFSK